MTITLANLAQATEQQIFNQVAKHLIKQGKRAISEGGACQFLTKDGLKCAAGCLIADSEYDPKYDEEGGWYFAVCSYPQEITSVHQDFIAELQDMHDSATSDWDPLPDEVNFNFTDRLKRFAEIHNLEFNDEELCAQK